MSLTVLAEPVPALPAASVHAPRVTVAVPTASEPVKK